jgi:hypothetical protein
MYLYGVDQDMQGIQTVDNVNIANKLRYTVLQSTTFYKHEQVMRLSMGVYL